MKFSKIKILLKSSLGMTLAEVMIAMGISSFIMTGVVLVYLMSIRMTSATIAQLSIQQTARAGMDQILHDVRRADRAIIYSSYQGQATFTGTTNSDAGAYIIFQIPTNSLQATTYSPTTDQPFHHYFIGNIRILQNGITNGTLYYFHCNTETNLSTASVSNVVIRGVTNPDHVFDWINGVVNVNIRIADENDADGKQIIYLRSAVSFRNGD